jgi:hypothetical protein
MPHADQVLGELGLAFDAALALRDHEGLEALLAQAAQDVDGRDVGVALGAARVLAGGEDRWGGGAHLLFVERRLAAQDARAVGKARGESGCCEHRCSFHERGWTGPRAASPADR